MSFNSQVLMALLLCAICGVTSVELDSSESGQATKLNKINKPPSANQRAPQRGPPQNSPQSVPQTEAKLEPQREDQSAPISALVSTPERTTVALTRPVQPTMPQCFQHFPGTPGWNDCFSKYTREMEEFQKKMHDYIKSTGDSNINDGGAGGFPGGSYSQQSQGFYNSASTSNAFVGGYSIHAINMGLSTSSSNGVLKVVFNINGPVDEFDKKVEGNEIHIRVISNAQRKSARVIVPKGIRMEDVKIDRAPDAIYLTGPTSFGGGFSSSVQQSSSSGSGSNFNQNFQVGQFQPGQLAPIPDFQNMFQNMFQNFLPSLFGGGPSMNNNGAGAGREFPASKQRMNNNVGGFGGSYYPIPGIWFF